MAGDFNPYHVWLGIPPEEQPANYYRLLGLKLFETNGDVIDSAADRQMAHLRTFQGGKHGDLTQRLLNEVAAARVCLLDPKKRAAYDQQLRAKLPAPVAVPPPPVVAAIPTAGGSATHRQPPRRSADAPVAAGNIPVAVAVPQPADQWNAVLGEPTARPAHGSATRLAGSGITKGRPARKQAASNRNMAIGIAVAVAVIAAAGIGWLALNGSPKNGTLVFDWPGADWADTTVTVDNAAVPAPANGPWQYQGPPGAHHVVAERLAYKLDANVIVAAGEQKTVPAEWKPKAMLVLNWPPAIRNGAELRIDGRIQLISQNQPLEVPVTPGRHVIQINRPRSAPITTAAVVEADGRQPVTITPPPTSAKLVFDWPADERKDAELVIDGSRQIVPSGSDNPSFGLIVSAGRHVVQITRTGFAPFEQVVDLSSGVNESLKPTWTPEHTTTPPVIADTNPVSVEPAANPAPSVQALQPIKKLPVPVAAEQEKIAKELDELYKLSRPGPKDPVKARELIDMAGKAGATPAERYMLLTKGAEIAAAAGDINLAMQAVDTLDAGFVIDALEVKQKLLDKCISAGKPDQVALAIPAAEQLIDQAVAADRYEIAVVLATSASHAAVKSKIPTHKEIDERLSRRRHEIHLLESLYAAAKKAEETLDKTPADPAANLDVGRWRAFYKQDWAAGLPLLVKGSDEKLKSLAQQELKVPTDVESQIQLADAWWNLAQKEAGIARDSLHLHAGGIYQAALPNLTSAIKKAAIEKRLAEIADLKPIATPAAANNAAVATKLPLPSAGRIPLGEWVDLLPLVDLSRDSIRGNWSRSGAEIAVQSSELPMFEIPVAIEGAYDLEVDFTRADGNDSIDTIIAVGTHQCSLKLSGWAGKVSGLALVDGRQPVDAGYSAPMWPGGLENGRRYRLLVRVRMLPAGRASIDVSLNGKAFLPSWTGDQSSLMPGFQLSNPKYLGFSANWSHTIYHAVRLKMISGNALTVGLRAESVPPLPAPADSNSSPPGGKTKVVVGRWIDLLRQVDPIRDAVSGKWTRDGANVSCSPGYSQLKLPAAPSVSYDFEVEFTRTTSDSDVLAFFTVGPRMVMLVLGAHHGAVGGLQEIDGLLADAGGNPTHKSVNNIQNGRRYRLLIKVRNLSGGRGSVDVSLDGAPYLPHWEGSVNSLALPASWAQSTPHQLAVGAFENNTTFHSARFRTVKVQLAGTTPTSPAISPSSKPNDSDSGAKLTFTKWTYVADEAGRSGDFEKNATGWIEMKDGKVWAHFQESARNAKYVELFDANRHIWVRITPTEASWSRDRAVWITAGKGAPASEP